MITGKNDREPRFLDDDGADLARKLAGDGLNEKMLAKAYGRGLRVGANARGWSTKSLEFLFGDE